MTGLINHVTAHALLGQTVHVVPDTRDGSGERAGQIASASVATPNGRATADIHVLTTDGRAYNMTGVPHSLGKEPRTWHLPNE